MLRARRVAIPARIHIMAADACASEERGGKGREGKVKGGTHAGERYRRPEEAATPFAPDALHVEDIAP